MSTEQSQASRGLQREARVAGLRDFESPTLESVERRRWQLVLIASVVLIGISGALVLLTFEDAPIHVLPDLFTVRILFLVLSASISLYLLDKEVRLGKLTRTLVDERVLTAALSNRLKEVSVLSDVGKAINELLDLEALLQMILDSAIDLLEAQEGSIMLLDEERGELIAAAWRSTREDLLQGTTVKVGEGIAGWVAENREPLLITGEAPAEGFTKLEEKERDIRSSMSVPLVGRGDLYGVLNINKLDGSREFNEYDLRSLGLFAQHAAVAIRNARVYEQEKRAVARLREVDRIKSDFVASVSHELRTPLTSIIGSARTVRQRRDDLAEEQQTELLQVIERQGMRLLRIIEEMLSASKLESGQPLRREQVEVVDIARHVVQGMETTGMRNPTTIESPAKVVAYGNSGAIEQILTNLVDNASKYSDPDRPIRIRLSDEPGVVNIDVIDEGRGIDQADLPTIFDRFRQLDAAGNRAAAGVGLGLYIVKNLVTASGGEMSVESEVGKGSKFSVSLPKRRE